MPREHQGAGRIDNPDLYAAVYLSDSPGGAIAETFGSVRAWSADMFLSGGASRAVYALATYRLTDDRVLDLDDPAALPERSLRPSRIVSRDREITQAWARAIFQEEHWVGVSWWSYYDPRWASVGLWDRRSLRVSGRPLALDPGLDAVQEAADILNRVWVER